MKNLTLSFLLAFISIVFATTARAQAPEQARNFQINATHTGSISVEKLTPPLQQRWVVDFGQPISYPLIADGKVFVTVKSAHSQGTTLYALDATNGWGVWAFDLGGSSPWSAACYENGRVFALNNDGFLFAFDGATGWLIWVIQLPGQFFFDAPPTVHEGVIYVSGSGSGGTVYAVTADSGSVLWTSPVINGGTSSPAVTSTGVWVSYSCLNVYRLHPFTGQKIWHHAPSCSGGGGKTPALYERRLYVRDFSDTIFDSTRGTIVGNFNAKNTPAFSGGMGFFLNGPHSFGSYGVLEARDAVFTDLVWWQFSGDGFLQSAVLVVNNYVYVGSESGKLYAVDAATGEQVWETTAGTSIPYVDEQNVSQPVTGFAAAEGILVVPTSTTLVAYERDSTPPTLTWGTPTPAPNSAGWNNTPPEIPFTTSDESGVQSSDPESPLVFAVGGANLTEQVTVTDKAGNTATFTSPAVNYDPFTPFSEIIIPGVSHQQEWFTGPVPVTINAFDSISSVASTFYRINGGPVQVYTSKFTISADGNYTIEFWSVDVADNIEPLQTRTMRIDSTTPVTQALASGTGGTNGWHQSAVQVSLSATDNLSGVQSTFYQIDGGAIQTYAGPFGISTLGQHTVEYWSVDNLNNTEATKSLALKIDTVAPVVTASASPATANKSPRPVTVTISGSATDGISGISSASFNVIDEYGVTQPSGPVTVQANGSYSFTLTLPASKNGSDKNGHLYTIILNASDQAGNSASATTTLTIN